MTDGAEEPLRYVQFAQWQKDLVEGDDETAINGREFWKKNADVATALPLPNELKAQESFFPAVMVNRAGCGYVEQGRVPGRKISALPAAKSCSLRGNPYCGGSPGNPRLPSARFSLDGSTTNCGMQSV